MIKKYISHSGVTIEVGDFYGGGTDTEDIGEVVSSLEDNLTNLTIITNMDIYVIPLQVGDYIGMTDGSGKVIKTKHNDDNDNL